MSQSRGNRRRSQHAKRFQLFWLAHDRLKRKVEQKRQLTIRPCPSAGRILAWDRSGKADPSDRAVTCMGSCIIRQPM